MYYHGGRLWSRLRTRRDAGTLLCMLRRNQPIRIDDAPLQTLEQGISRRRTRIGSYLLRIYAIRSAILASVGLRQWSV